MMLIVSLRFLPRCNSPSQWAGSPCALSIHLPICGSPWGWVTISGGGCQDGVTGAATFWKAQPEQHDPMTSDQHTHVHPSNVRLLAIGLPLSFLQNACIPGVFLESHVSGTRDTWFPESVAGIIPRYPGQSTGSRGRGWGFAQLAAAGRDDGWAAGSQSQCGQSTSVRQSLEQTDVRSASEVVRTRLRSYLPW